MDKATKKEFEKLARMTKHGFDSVDKRFITIDKRFEQVDKRFDKLETRVDGMAKQMFTKEDAKDLKERIKGLATREQMRKSLANDDKILKKLETLEQEKIVREYQEENKRKVLLIIIGALYKHKILTKSQLEEINQLGAI